MERTEYWIRPGQGKAIALIHGIGAKDPQAYWQDFLSVLMHDENLQEFGVFVWKYPTHVQPDGIRNALSTMKRKTLRETAPRIAPLGSAWSTTYHMQFQGYQDVVLVCHSMGGLVIKSWILETLEQGQSTNLATLRHIAFYATPHQGAPVTMLAQWNKQLKDMQLDSPFIEDVGRRWYDHVVAWKEHLPGPADERFNRFIPHLVLAGLNDTVVPSWCATIRGMSLTTIAGDHSQVIQPIDSNDTRYKIWRTHLDEMFTMISPKIDVSSSPDQQMRLAIDAEKNRIENQQVVQRHVIDHHNAIIPQFDVCVVCALPEEARAFLAIVQQQGEGVIEERISPRYHYSYRFVTFKNDKDEPLNLHVSWLPRYGPQEMTLHLSRVLEECQPRIAIMTGICAGDAQHVQLGDLVVAERTFTYDNGKFTHDEYGRSVHQHDAMTYQLDANILQFLGLFDVWKPLVARLKRPPSPPEQRKRRKIACHIKAMASGSAVRADHPFEDVRAPVRGTVAIDMEGAAFGLVMSRHPLTRWLVVKGVCDYADKAKSDAYHDYAARASALYALSFIRAYVTNERLPQLDDPSSSSRAGPSGVWNVPYDRNRYFTGREQELEQLHTQLQHSNTATIGQTRAISGLGGISETQLAVEYAYRYRQEYEYVLWVRADNLESLNVSYTNIARLLSLPEKDEREQDRIIQSVKHWLRTHQGYLLILDNANEPDVLLPFMPQVAGGHLLITTRSTAVRRLNIARPLVSITLDEAPQNRKCYGREKELATLQQWLLDDHCKLVALLGIGGIGKTSLAVTLTEQLKDRFEYVCWYTLQNSPTLESLLERSILFFSDQQHVALPKDVDSQITLLLEYLKKRLCLLILDNVEAILQGGDHVGQYRKGFEAYGRLFRRIGETRHASCLLVTSREKPREIAQLEGPASSVCSLELFGLGEGAVQELLQNKGLFGPEEAWSTLNYKYSGNPLALQLAAGTIQGLFGGDIFAFLKEKTLLVGNTHELFEQQFERLSSLEQTIMYWLAIAREAVSLDELRADIIPVESKKTLLIALESLRQRSMVDSGNLGHFLLQPVIMEYVIDRLTNYTYNEIIKEDIKLLASHALIKAQSKEYIRETQVSLILEPVAERLLAHSRQKEIEKKLLKMLASLRKIQSSAAEYTAGNICNLLVQLQCNLRGYNFSRLHIRQAYLRGIALPETNFMQSRLTQCVFTENFGSVLAVALSPKSSILAAGTADGEIRLWSITTGTALKAYQGHTDLIWSVAFSPDEDLLASSSEDETIRIWDVKTGACINTLRGHSSWIRDTTFSPNGKLLASASADRTIRLWDVRTGECLNILEGHTNWVRSVSFGPGGMQLASSSEDETVRLWDVRTGICLRVLQGHTGKVWSVSFSPNGHILASGGEDQVVRLWDVETGDCIQVLRGHTHRVRSVVFSPDGKLLASGSEDQTIRLWDTTVLTCLKTLQGYDDRIRAIAFGMNSAILASGSMNQMVRVWDVRTGYCLKTLQGYTARIWAIAFSPDGHILASAGLDQMIRLWDVQSDQCLKTLVGHANHIHAVAFSPDGKLLASSSNDQTIRLWNVKTGRCLTTLQGHTSWVWSIAFSPDGKILASGSIDQTIRLWDVDTYQCISILQGHTNHVRTVIFSPDGSVLASCGDDQTIRTWNAKTGESLSVLQGHSDCVWSIAFSPDGKMLASGSEDRTIMLWEVSGEDHFATLQGHTGSINTVAFHPDGYLLVSGSSDHTVRLWDIQTKSLYTTLQGHNESINAIVFRQVDSVLASGSDDGSIRFWDLQTMTCLKTLRNERPYEGMNVTGVTGLTEAQKVMLEALGAVEDDFQTL